MDTGTNIDQSTVETTMAPTVETTPEEQVAKMRELGILAGDERGDLDLLAIPRAKSGSFQEWMEKRG